MGNKLAELALSPDHLDEPYKAAGLRDKYKGDPLNQSLLAPFEHMDYAREAVSERPYLAAPLAIAAPAYQTTKALTADKPTTGTLGNLPALRLLSLYNQSTMGDQKQTGADIDQLIAAYRGIYQGLTQKAPIPYWKR